jgi:hypothetical protein
MSNNYNINIIDQDWYSITDDTKINKLCEKVVEIEKKTWTLGTFFGGKIEFLFSCLFPFTFFDVFNNNDNNDDNNYNNDYNNNNNNNNNNIINNNNNSNNNKY